MASLLPHLDAASRHVRLHLAGDAFAAGELVRGILIATGGPDEPEKCSTDEAQTADAKQDPPHQRGTPPQESIPGTNDADETAADATAEIGAITNRLQGLLPPSAAAAERHDTDACAVLHLVGVEELPHGERSVVTHTEQPLDLPSGFPSRTKEARVPFRLTLPHSLSGSYLGIHGHVRYALVLELEHSGTIERSATPLQVFARWDDLISQGASLKQSAEEQQESKQATLAIRLTSNLVLARTSVPVPFTLTNNSPKPLNNIRLSLLQKELILPPPPADLSSSDVKDHAAPLHTMEKEIQTSTLGTTYSHDSWWPGVLPNEKLEWAAHLDTPATTASLSTAGGLARVRVFYTLVVQALSEDDESIVKTQAPIVIASPMSIGTALGLGGQQIISRFIAPPPGLVFSAPHEHGNQASDSSASLSAGGLVPPAPFRGRRSGLSPPAPSGIPRSSSPPATPRGKKLSSPAALRKSPSLIPQFPSNDSADSTTVDLEVSDGPVGGDLSGISEHTENTDTDTSANSHASTAGDDSSESHAAVMRQGWPGAEDALDLGAPPTVPAVGSRGLPPRRVSNGPNRFARPSPSASRGTPASTVEPSSKKDSTALPSRPGAGGLASRRRQAQANGNAPTTTHLGPSSSVSSGEATGAGPRSSVPSPLKRSASSQSLSSASARSSGVMGGTPRTPASGPPGRPAGRVVSGTPSIRLNRSTSTHAIPPQTPTSGLRRSASRGDLTPGMGAAGSQREKSPSATPVRRTGVVGQSRPQSMYVGSKEQTPPVPSANNFPRARVDSARTRTDSNASLRARRITSGSSLSAHVAPSPTPSSGARNAPTVRSVRPGARQASVSSMTSGPAVKAKVSLDQIIAPPPPPVGGGGGRKAMTELGFGPPSGRTGRAASGLGVGGTSGLGAHGGDEPHGFTFKNYAAGGAEVRLGAGGVPHAPVGGMSRSKSHAHLAGAASFASGSMSGVDSRPKARVAASEIGVSAPAVRAKVSPQTALSSSQSSKNLTQMRTRTSSNASRSTAGQATTGSVRAPSRSAHLLAAPTSPVRARTKSVEL